MSLHDGKRGTGITVNVTDIRAGDAVEGTFAIVSKQRRHDRNGDPYLVLQLSDTTGRIEGRMWRNAEWFDERFGEGDRVRVVGRGTSFRDQVQLDLRRIDAVGGDADGASYVPMARRALPELAGELDFLAEEVAHPDQARLVAAVWQGPLRDELLRCPATIDAHHAYLGGLVEHTVSVASLCMTACDRHPALDRSLLLSAALLHDIGRVRELRSETSLAVDEAGGLVGHLLLGHELLIDAAARTRIDTSSSEWWPRLVHAVSTHHAGERPRTREATALQLANQLDARLATGGP